MKIRFTLAEFMIVMSVVFSLLVAILLLAFKNNENKEKPLNAMEDNNRIIKDSWVQKEFEFCGYDVYSFRLNGHALSFAIPTTNSLYKLEK